jgi:hypothetical protein
MTMWIKRRRSYATTSNPLKQNWGRPTQQKEREQKREGWRQEVKEDVGDGRRPIYCDPQEQESEEGHKDEEESCHESFACFSHRQHQCLQCRQQKIKEESYCLQVRWERTREVSRCMQLVRATEWRVRSCFSFLPNLALSIHKNAREVMGDTSPWCYFLKAMNMAFHDLTRGKSLPPATTSLLGLSLKFIPTPCYTPSATDVAPSFDRIECNIGLKTFFAGHDQEKEIPKLRAKSQW